MPSPALGLCFLEQAAHQLWGERRLVHSPACPHPGGARVDQPTASIDPGSSGRGPRCQSRGGKPLEQECPGKKGRMGAQSAEAQEHLELALGKHFHHGRVKAILVSV